MKKKEKDKEDGWLCVEFAKMTVDPTEEYWITGRCLLLTLATGVAIVEPFVVLAKKLGIEEVR